MGFGSALSSQFSGFGSGVFQGFAGADYIKDYKHASKTFVADGFALAPNNKFLFHVYFNLNTAGIPQLAEAIGGLHEKNKIGLMVKSITLPSYDVEVDALNQYNRKRLIQKKINYKPVQITLHDDGTDLIRSMWYNYYSYYYHDSGHKYDGSSQAYSIRDIYNASRSEQNWGYNERAPFGADSGVGSDQVKPPFFQDITIYGFNRGNFVEYTLINPTIMSWEHDMYDYSSGGEVMQNVMSVEYETVKYARGKIASGDRGEDTVVKGFKDPAMYDSTKSALSKAGSTASLFGQGGILDAGAGIFEDLAAGDILGAVQKGSSVFNTFKDGSS